jgi:hypothetical protein
VTFEQLVTATGGGVTVTNSGPLTMGSMNLAGAFLQQGGGSVSAAGTVTAGSAITFTNAVTLRQDTSDQSSGGGNITFDSTVDGAQKLEVDTTGNEFFNGVVGGTTPLASLTTDGDAAIGVGGQAQFNMTAAGGTNPAGVNVAGAVTIHDTVAFNVGGGTQANPSVKTGGPQTYAGAATLQQNTYLESSGGGNITFSATVDAASDGGQSLEVDTTGNEVFGGLVGGAARLSSLTTDGYAAIGVGGQAQFNMTIPPAPGGSDPAGVNVMGDLTINDGVSFNVTNSTQANPSVTTTGAQVYGADLGAKPPTAFGAILTQDAYLQSTGGGNITFDSTVDGSTKGDQNLGVGTTGTWTFNGNVGSSCALATVKTLGTGTATIAAGVSITTFTNSTGSTSAVSSLPPVLYIYPISSTQEVITGNQLTQTIYGYIGYIPAGSPPTTIGSPQSPNYGPNYREQGQNFDITVNWADHSTSDVVFDQTAPGSTVKGSVDSGGVTVLASSYSGSGGNATDNWQSNPGYGDIPAAAQAFTPAPPNNAVVFVLSHTYTVNSLIGVSSLTAVVTVTNNSGIVLGNPANDRTTAQAPLPANSQNATQAGTSVNVVSGFGSTTPAAFAPPPTTQAPPVIVQTVLSNTTVQVVTHQEDAIFRSDTVTGESRTIEICKVNPDGSEKVVFSDDSEKLNELLERLRRGAYLNGRYRVYLTVTNLADKQVIEQRLLMEIYKSGTSLGDPVHEPGPGDRPLEDKAKPAGASQVAPQQPPAQARGGEKQQPAAAGESLPAETPHAAGELPKAASRPDKSGEPQTRLSHAAIRYPLVGAAVVAMGGLGARPLQEAWARRVDRALGSGQSSSLGRAARLSRFLRKSKP